MGSRPPELAQGCKGGCAPPPPPPPPPPPLSVAAGMPKLSKETKQRLQQLFKGGQFAIRWGFIPVVLYLGFKRGADPGMPEPTIWRACLSSPHLHCCAARNRIIDVPPLAGTKLEGFLLPESLVLSDFSFARRDS
uniref:Mitochondrial import receptor subunit TOM7 homolog n=1 Tax=Amazona collaria TaxID=241587 RepID=A0A8B9FQ61_9PSIT